MKITYFVHSTTRDNEAKRASGQSDVHLSDLGLKQNEELAEIVRGKHFDMVFCSDLTRAIHTAQIAFDRYDITIDQRLRECHYGDYTARPNIELDTLGKTIIETPFPHGESYYDVERRIRSFLEEIYDEFGDKHIAIVAHKVPQFAFEVISEGKTREQAIDEDRRKQKVWKPGWEYEINLQQIQNTPKRNHLLSILTDTKLGLPLEQKTHYSEKHATRGVVLDTEGKVALLQVVKYNMYKLPGGSIEPGETISDSLIREISEEAGVEVRIKQPIGKIIEYRSKRGFKQTSHGYLAQVVGEKQSPEYTHHEIEFGFKVLWIDIDEAIHLLQTVKPKDYAMRFIQARDLQILMKAKELIS